MYQYDYNPNTGYFELTHDNKLYQFVSEYEAIEFISELSS